MTISIVVPALMITKKQSQNIVCIDDEESNDSAPMHTVKDQFLSSFDKHLAQFLKADSIQSMATILDPRLRSELGASGIDETS